MGRSNLSVVPNPQAESFATGVRCAQSISFWAAGFLPGFSNKQEQMVQQDSLRSGGTREARATGDAPEMPLRDRKKARQRSELLRVALDLFRQEGFDKTRMEDIAVQASVSTPTLYNYFAGKREVLIEILMEDRREAQEQFERLTRNPPAEPSAGFAALIYANMKNIRESGEKRLWRELIAAVAKSHDRERDPFDLNHEVFKRFIKRLLCYYVSADKVSSAVPVDLATEVIFAINSHNLRHLVASESCTPERIRTLARRQLMLLMSGWSGRAPATLPVRRPSAPEA